MFKKSLAVAGALAFLGTGCASNSTESQIQRACIFVNGWPADYASLWPAVVENAVPKGLSAGEEMSRTYLQPMIDEFDITNPTALRIAREYQDYWILLEREIIQTGQLPDANSPSTRLLAGLQEECAPYDDYQ